MPFNSLWGRWCPDTPLKAFLRLLFAFQFLWELDGVRTNSTRLELPAPVLRLSTPVGVDGCSTGKQKMQVLQYSFAFNSLWELDGVRPTSRNQDNP